MRRKCTTDKKKFRGARAASFTEVNSAVADIRFTSAVSRNTAMNLENMLVHLTSILCKFFFYSVEAVCCGRDFM